ncbi:hypothetical protein COLO4_25722 [Corchorus olitorius]|uniref:Uncharacterized protein n=1 Tax=Corchorus olitorius TaxID=93759 RepID=A0A1R3I098_9ROSI|nr:hypothetical protein COLO4_25722 [Corchorus olitorius]
MVVVDNLDNFSDAAIKKVEELATKFSKNLFFNQVH